MKGSLGDVEKMEGIFLEEHGKYQRMHEHIKNMNGLDIFSISLEAMNTLEKKLKVCAVLEGDFPSMRSIGTMRQTTLTYRGQPEQYKFPLVFSVSFPPKYVFRSVWAQCPERGVPDAQVKTPIPCPPRNALRRLNATQDLFDYVELWWIPKDAVADGEIVVPDRKNIHAMLVGGVELVANKTVATFEICQWVDKTSRGIYWTEKQAHKYTRTESSCSDDDSPRAPPIILVVGFGAPESTRSSCGDDDSPRAHCAPSAAPESTLSDHDIFANDLLDDHDSAAIP